jgi:hypothetical protein
MPRNGSRKETPEAFHRRIIDRCEVLAARYEVEAANPSPRARESILAKAEAERRNAEHHRGKLAALGIKI